MARSFQKPCFGLFSLSDFGGVVWLLAFRRVPQSSIFRRERVAPPPQEQPYVQSHLFLLWCLEILTNPNCKWCPSIRFHPHSHTTCAYFGRHSPTRPRSSHILIHASLQSSSVAISLLLEAVRCFTVYNKFLATCCGLSNV